MALGTFLLKLHDPSLSHLVTIRITWTTQQEIDVQVHRFLSQSTLFTYDSTYDFLLVINCQLSSISHDFRDIVSQTQSKTTPSQFELLDQGGPLQIS